MRLFIGLAPPSAALDDLDAACAPLRAGRDDLRWTSRDLWHVTLAFLGEVSDESLAGLVPGLERAARASRTFGLRVAGAGAFANPARANVLWSGIAGDLTALAGLAAAVSAAAHRAGAPPTDAFHGFTPHLTLARCRAPADVRELVDRLHGYQGPAWAVEEIYLIRNTLGGSKPRYEALGAWKLRLRTGLASPGSGRRSGGSPAPAG
jgi:2'-5' RNA ligase